MFKRLRDRIVTYLAYEIGDYVVNEINPELNAIDNELRRIKKDQYDRIIQLSEKNQRLVEFKAGIESVGIARKFGNRIDVGFDRFLDSIGPTGEKQLAEIIEDRKKNGRPDPT